MTYPAQNLKHCGVRIYGVGVGYNFDIKQLERMSSRPVSENVFIGPFNKLQYIRDDLVRSVCYGRLILFLIITKNVGVRQKKIYAQMLLFIVVNILSYNYQKKTNISTVLLDQIFYSPERRKHMHVFQWSHFVPSFFEDIVPYMSVYVLATGSSLLLRSISLPYLS